MSREDSRKIDYTVAVVGEFARRHSISQKEAFGFLDRYGAIGFIKEHYEIEHTLSLEDVLEDMLIICGRNGGVLS